MGGAQAAAAAVQAKLRLLERGEWDGSVACPLRGSGSTIPVYEAKPLDNVRILWQARPSRLLHSSARGDVLSKLAMA